MTYSMMSKAHTTRLCLAGFLAAAIVSAGAVDARAQTKELSDNSVKSLMNYAWALMPGPKVTMQDGKEILIEESKREEIMVPVDAAREVIRVGRISANAQTCCLGEQQAANHEALMKRERAKNKWTPQQMIYINQLHLFTVMLMTGGVKLIEKDDDGGKEVVIENAKLNPPKKDACTEVERKKVAEQVDAYLAAK
jgi:hypothetical protein